MLLSVEKQSKNNLEPDEEGMGNVPLLSDFLKRNPRPKTNRNARALVEKEKLLVFHFAGLLLLFVFTRRPKMSVYLFYLQCINKIRVPFEAATYDISRTTAASNNVFLNKGPNSSEWIVQIAYGKRKMAGIREYLFRLLRRGRGSRLENAEVLVQYRLCTWMKLEYPECKSRENQTK
jgi:hypothetical protein